MDCLEWMALLCYRTIGTPGECEELARTLERHKDGQHDETIDRFLNYIIAKKEQG